MVSGRVVTNPPLFTPALYGLLGVAQDATASMPSHWEAGITYQPLCAAPGSTYDECLSVTGVGAVAEPPAKSQTYTTPRMGATPFTVVVRNDCSAPTHWDTAVSEAVEVLTEAEAWQVERTFWTGLAAGNKVVSPHLAANAQLIDTGDTMQLAATQVITGAAVDIVEGLGKLEQALANCYQGQGVIHIPQQLAPAMAAQMLLIKDGPRYRTPGGNLVALGRGYPGTAPDGTSPAGTVWIYATGAVFYARSEIRTPSRVESLVRSNNSLQQMSERTYIVAWDCCLLGVPITATGEPAGT